MQTLEAVAVSLEVGCDGGPLCAELSGPLYLQLSRGNYGECSVLAIPDSIAGWRDEHRTARKRADRAARRGYRFAEIQREQFADDIFEINTSLEQRQGRPMSSGYRERTTFSPLPVYICARHRVSTYGVLKAERLVAYLWLYRAGDLALVSTILGHGDHLEDEVMYLLMQGAIRREIDTGGYLVFNRHDSGTDGLRFFKERVGFAESPVGWLS